MTPDEYRDFMQAFLAYWYEQHSKDGKIDIYADWQAEFVKDLIEVTTTEIKMKVAERIEKMQTPSMN